MNVMTNMIRCTACGYQIPAAVFASSREGACPLCRRPVQAVLLPAMSQAPKAASPPMLPEEPPAPGEATCFYSPNRRATHTCSHCGVYVSDAWSAQWGTDYVCLKCLDDLRGHRKDARFEVRRVLWDNIALGTALLPFLICVPLLLLGPAAVIFIAFPVMASVITAPLALAFSIYAWKKPRSMVPRGAARTVWALVLSLLQCGAWGAFIFAALSQTFLR